jgi:polysaccharide export outer membrane protein
MMITLKRTVVVVLGVIFVIGAAQLSAAQQAPAAQKPPVAQQPPQPLPPKPAPPKAATPTPPAAAPQAVPPADYTIGADDVLVVMFRREKDMSAEVMVRPDGKITLPLINDLQVAGLTTDQLRAKVTEEAKRFVEDPSVTVMVKQINSRKVFITGQVGRAGPYPVGDHMTVMQLISMAGGLTEYAKKKDIVILREAAAKPGSKPTTFRFNYDDIQKLKNLASNIELKPGDTVIVP